MVVTPALGLFSFIIYKLLKKPLRIAFVKIKQKLPPVKSRLLVICCKKHVDDRAQNEEQGNTINRDHDAEIQLPDRIVHPELYTQEDNYTN